MLNEADENAESQHHGRNKPRGQDRKDAQNHVFGRHVPKEPDGQRNRPHDMADELDDEHHRSQQQDRSHEVLHILHTVHLYPVVMRRQKHGNGHRGGHVEIAVGAVNPGMSPMKLQTRI